ncbi:MAG: hypothetical protein HOI43_18750 [Gammaproteobacteria bacterium]|nr:hypothetical protein [Gammaproteobacteria bacterium]
MNDGVGIRRAVPSDADLLVELQSMVQTSQDSNWDEVLPWHLWLTDSQFFTYVAEQSVLIGAVAVGPIRDSDLVGDDLLDGNPGEIIAWFIHPDQDYQKLGRKLLVHGLTVLKRCFFESAVIWVASNSKTAPAVIQSLHFWDTGLERVRNLSSKSINENCYKLHLGSYF